MGDNAAEINRDRRAMEIFAEVVGLSAAERACAIERACADNAGVRTRVEAMLAVDSADESTGVREADVDGFIARQIQHITPTTAALDAQSPPVDDQYTILRVIGEGGMGTVYEAEQHSPRRRVAIKAIRPTRLTAEMSKRFEYEAQVLARLEHPGIARLYESNTETEGEHVRAYLAMELVNGVPLDVFCAEHQLSPVERLRLFMRVCEAVAYAHRMGVIHRDLKPANILVNAEGEPKVLDFGVARTIERDKRAATLLTQHGQLIGTLGYMSPEQVEGRADVDTRADVYSLGVILYKLLTNRLPLDITSDSLIEASRRIVDETPARLGLIDRRLKGDLDVIVGRTLEKSPSRRYSSVDDLRQELERHLDGRPIEARADSAVYVFQKAVWRYRAPVSIGIVLLLLLTAFGVTASIQAGRNRHLADVADVARQAAVTSEARSTDRAEALRRQLYFSYIGFAQSALENSDMERAYLLLDECDSSLRDWEWSYLERLRDRSITTQDLHLERPRYVSLTRDRSMSAYATLGREIVAVNNSTHRELIRAQLPDGTARVALSPDGKWLAYGAIGASVMLQNVATGDRHALTVDARTIDPRNRALRALRFTSDSRRLLVAGADKTLRVWDVEDRALRQSITLGTLPICLTITPDDRLVIVGESDGAIAVVSLDAGVVRNELKGHDAPVWALAVSNDGKRLASGDNDARTIVWDIESGKSVMKVDSDDGWDTALCFSPDDRRLAVGRADSIVRILNVEDGTPAGVLLGHRHAVVRIEWENTNEIVTVSMDGTCKNWESRSATQMPAIVTSPAESIALAFDPRDQSLIVGSGDGRVKRWTSVTNRIGVPVDVATFDRHDGQVLEAAIDPVHRRLATGGKEGTIFIKNMDSGVELMVILPGTGGISAMSFAPDGNTLAIGTDHEISVWSATTGQRVHDYSSPDVIANEIAFDRDGRKFVAACADGHLRRYEIETSLPIADVVVDDHGLYDVQISPDGKAFAVGGDTQTVALVDAKSLQITRRFVGHPGGVLSVAFHPSGKRLASGGTDGSIRIWDIESGTELITLRGHRRRIEQLSFSPDGSTLASSSDDGTVKLWRTLGH